MSKIYSPDSGEIQEAYMSFVVNDDGTFSIIGPNGRTEPIDKLPTKIKINGKIMTQFMVIMPSVNVPTGTVGYE